jgi:hypothetical protein
MTSLSGLVKIWKVSLAGLPEKDKIDEEKTAHFLKEIYQQYKDQWASILYRVIGNVKIRMEKYLA